MGLWKRVTNKSIHPLLHNACGIDVVTFQDHLGKKTPTCQSAHRFSVVQVQTHSLQCHLPSVLNKSSHKCSHFLYISTFELWFELGPGPALLVALVC